MAANDWRASQLRLSVFPLAELAPEPENWWGETVGRDPNERQTRPRERSWSDQGALDSDDLAGTLELRRAPTRIDWLLDNPPLPDTQDTGGALVATEAFRELLTPWLRETGSDAKRVAFGATLDRRVPDRANGYRTLSAYLPFDLDDSSSDFLYQINRRRSVGPGAVTVNRLSKWSVAQFAGLSVDLSTQAASPLQPEYYARLELDINTAPDQEFPPDQTAPIFERLVSLAIEIMENGDLP